LEQLGQQVQQGTTLLLVTHRLEEIQPEISRVVFLKEGTVMADGPTDELLHDQPLSTLFNTLLRVVRGGGYPTGASSPKTSLSGRHPVLLTEGFAPAPKETATFERVREEEIGRGCFC
jgi:energy-coupling factor transporter ATP-binding protein EcfA2